MDDTIPTILLIPKIHNWIIWLMILQLKATRQYITKNTIPYIMPMDKSIDIDSQADFDLAEYYLNKVIKIPPPYLI